MSATATTKPQSTGSRSTTFDGLFVNPVGLAPVSARSAPSGWRRAPLLVLLDEQPRERRETLLALGFAVLAFVYGPLGIVALLWGWLSTLAVVTVLLAVALAAPRPEASAFRSRVRAAAPLRAAR